MVYSTWILNFLQIWRVSPIFLITYTYSNIYQLHIYTKFLWNRSFNQLVFIKLTFYNKVDQSNSRFFTNLNSLTYFFHLHLFLYLWSILYIANFIEISRCITTYNQIVSLSASDQHVTLKLFLTDLNSLTYFFFNLHLFQYLSITIYTKFHENRSIHNEVKRRLTT